MVGRARARVEFWLLSDGPEHEVYARRWLDLLSRPVDEIAVALVEDSQPMRDLRQVSPFAGVLSDEERVATIRRTI